MYCSMAFICRVPAETKGLPSAQLMRAMCRPLAGIPHSSMAAMASHRRHSKRSTKVMNKVEVSPDPAEPLGYAGRKGSLIFPAQLYKRSHGGIKRSN